MNVLTLVRRVSFVILVSPFALGSYAKAEGVLSTYIAPIGPSPILTLTQEENTFGQSSYTNVVESDFTLQVEVYGGCDFNWRVQAASLSECGNAAEVCPATATTPPIYSHSLSVNQNAKSFGPRIETVQVPTSIIEHKLVSAANNWIAYLAANTNFSAAEWRALDLEVPFDWSLYFVFWCRRYFLNNDIFGQSSGTTIPITLKLRRTNTGDADLPFGIQPNPPNESPQSIPLDELVKTPDLITSRLNIVPIKDSDPCSYQISNTFETKSSTRITYHIVDQHGAASPEYAVESDAYGSAVVSHNIEFSEGSSTAIGLTIRPHYKNAEAIPELQSIPKATLFDPLHGAWRIETLTPSVSSSNIVSYNLRECEGSEAPLRQLFDTRILGSRK